MNVTDKGTQEMSHKLNEMLLEMKSKSPLLAMARSWSFRQATKLAPLLFLVIGLTYVLVKPRAFELRNREVAETTFTSESLRRSSPTPVLELIQHASVRP